MRSYPNKPDYYLYQKDGVWFKTDSSATNAISERIFAHRGASLPKVEYIPTGKREGLKTANIWLGRLIVMARLWFDGIGKLASILKNAVGVFD